MPAEKLTSFPPEGRVFLLADFRRPSGTPADHADEYATCWAAIAVAVAVAEPWFIGQALRKTGNFEMLRRVRQPDGKAVLVAIGLPHHRLPVLPDGARPTSFCERARN